MELNNKVAVVTGASSGIGREFARALVEEGAQVFGLARRLDAMIALRDEIGERFTPIACDVRYEDQVEDAFRSVIGDGGRLDVLVNNAGLGKYAAVDQMAVEDWDVQMETNLRGVFLCTRAAVPQMKRQNADAGFGGHIVNVASIAGLVGNANLEAYNASKFGVRGFSDGLMKELRADGIKVTCIYPGSIESDFSRTSGSRRSSNPMRQEDIAATVLHVLKTHENYLISEVVMRPLRPGGS
jgi:NAD(P)-dependent dehydrogenase (short-subunit alcohol dehydrogenase family)